MELMEAIHRDVPVPLGECFLSCHSQAICIKYCEYMPKVDSYTF